jgi:phosphonate transport system substrate-binding protein
VKEIVVMKRRRVATALATAVVALLIASGCGQSVDEDGSGDQVRDSPALTFVSVPSQQPANLRRLYQPILEMVGKETNREIRLQSATDYAAVITGLREGTIDIAELGALSYALAKQQGAQITLVAAQVPEKNRRPEYRSYGITPVGSLIKNLVDFRGKKICFTDRYSTSGYLYPAAALLGAGIDPERDITPIFAGGHDASVLNVANGLCDAGFAFDRMVDRQLIEQRQVQPGKIVTVWKSEPIPGGVIVIANHLPALLRQQLSTAIQQHANADYLRVHGFCQRECLIASLDTYGFVAVDDAIYDGIREACRITRLKSICS